MHNKSKNCGDSEKLFLTAEVNQIHQDIVKVKLGYVAEDWTFATCYL